MRSLLFFFFHSVVQCIEMSPFDKAFHDYKYIKLQNRYNAGSTESKVIDGHEAEVGRYPYMVSLMKHDFNFCGGTLVAPQWVIAAAHCIGRRATHIRIGHHNQTDIPDSAELIKVQYQVLHPCYNDITLENDVMIIKLWNASSFDSVKLDTGDYFNEEEDIGFPFDLPLIGNILGGIFQTSSDGDFVPEGTDVAAIGWGRTSFGGNASDVLLEVDLQIISNDNCKDAIQTILPWYLSFFPLSFIFRFVYDSMICAVAEEDEATVCNGDSGGPLIIKGSNGSQSDLQVGISSWNMLCDGAYPSAFTNVANVYDFVKDEMANSVAPECNTISTNDDDDFDYSGCDVPTPCWIGDDICDGDNFNSTECNYDGGDCRWCPFPDDGFDYSDCDDRVACFLGDGICRDQDEQWYACNYGAGDCDESCPFPNDGFNYSECKVDKPCQLGDNFCDGDNYNVTECNFDGGDCISECRAGVMQSASEYYKKFFF